MTFSCFICISKIYNKRGMIIFHIVSCGFFFYHTWWWFYQIDHYFKIINEKNHQNYYVSMTLTLYYGAEGTYHLHTERRWWPLRICSRFPQVTKHMSTSGKIINRNLQYLIQKKTPLLVWFCFMIGFLAYQYTSGLFFWN